MRNSTEYTATNNTDNTANYRHWVCAKLLSNMYNLNFFKFTLHIN